MHNALANGNTELLATLMRVNQRSNLMRVNHRSNKLFDFDFLVGFQSSVLTFLIAIVHSPMYCHLLSRQR